MFRSNKSGGREQTNGLGRPGMPTIIGADFRVKGDISCEGDIQLEGTVDGNIKSVRLTVGETGIVNGDVNAEGVRVQGKVVGTIRAKTVDLAGTGHVTGDILHERLSVENGAFLNGHCRRMSDEEIQRDHPPATDNTDDDQKADVPLTLVSNAS
jgi:cytoskeletal protein CcmA (bactofilin family)